MATNMKSAAKILRFPASHKITCPISLRYIVVFVYILPKILHLIEFFVQILKKKYPDVLSFGQKITGVFLRILFFRPALKKPDLFAIKLTQYVCTIFVVPLRTIPYPSIRF